MVLSVNLFARTVEESDGAFIEPQVIVTSHATYPEVLIKEGIEGVVQLKLLISEAGMVESASIAESVHPLLDSLALKAAQKLQFSPATDHGEAVAVELYFEYPFYLSHILDSLCLFTTVGGKVREKGTGNTLREGFIILSMIKAPESKRELSPTLYLKKLAKIEDQSVEDSKIITKIDSTGSFSLTLLSSAEYTLEVVSTGYKSFSQPLLVNDEKEISLTCRLLPDMHSTYEVVAYYEGEHLDITKRELRTNEIKKIPGFAKDVVRSVQALPGVARPAWGGSDISIRGAEPQQNRYYVDGISIPYLWHFQFLGVTSILNTNVIDKMSMYPGGYGTRYGNSLGGVMEFTTKKLDSSRVHGVFDIGITNSSLSVEVPIGDKLHLLAAYRRDYLLSMMNFVSKKVYNEELDMGGYFSDFAIKLQYEPNENHHLFGMLFGTKDTLFEMYDFEQGSHIDNEDRFTNGKGFTQGIVGWDWAINKRFRNSFRYGLRQLKRDDNIFDVVKIKHRGYVHEIRNELTFDLSEKLSLTGGLDLHIEPDSLQVRNSVGIDDYDYDTLVNPGSLGGYIRAKITPNEKLTLIPEFRLDHFPDPHYSGSILPEFWDYDFDNSTNNSVEPSLRMSSTYKLHANHLLKASAGTYNQNKFDTFLSRYQSTNLRLTKGAHYTFGHEWQIGDFLSLESEIYVNRQWDRTRSSTAEEYEKNPNVLIRSGNKAHMHGVELMLKQHKRKRFSGWLCYSLAQSKRYDQNAGKWHYYSGDLRHNFQFVGNWQLNRGFEFGTRLQITDGLPYTPQKLEYYDVDQNQYIAIGGDYNSQRHSPFIGLDLRLDKRFVFKRTTMSIYLESIRTLHWLSLIKKEDGTAIYMPKESDDYYYDYSGFEPAANYPIPGAGIEITF